MKVRCNARYVMCFSGCILLSILSGNYSYANAEEPTRQVTTGDQSPAIVAGGNVAINYGGVSQEIVNP